MGTITVTHLGKAYKQYPSRWSRLFEWLDPRSKPRHQLHWVLQDLNFSVSAGEAVGIIGINGAGKSTMLKMIVGTTQPTTGSVQMTGRVAALLELGMGFHPDFTGRQNAIMAGQLLGMSVEEVVALMPEIEAFAEIGEYIDQPVRVYSSGMQVRLAFAVATARRPDILIVDEALSVGDTYFQHKSFERIREFRAQGTTLLIVSHDKAAIQAICDRAILLNAGRLAMEGEPEAVMDYYNALLARHQNQSIRQEVLANGKLQTISGTGEASISNIKVLSETGQPVEILNVGQVVTFRIDVQVHAFVDQLVLGYGIRDRLGQIIYGTNTALQGKVLPSLQAGSHIRFDIQFPVNIGPGNYSVQTSLAGSETHVEKNYEWRELALIFEVINANKPYFAGVAWINPEISIDYQT